MATESGFITLEDLKRQAEEIGREEKEKTKFLTQEWKMRPKNEVRKLKLVAEVEERKLAAEEIGCRGTEIKIGGRSRGTEIGCRSRGKEIGCRGSGAGSGEKTQAREGKVATRKREIK